MDFGTAPEIVAALHDAVSGYRFGYLPDVLEREMAEACAAWFAAEFQWQIEPETIFALPDVIRGLEIAIDHYSRAGSAVILPTPAYMPFFDVPRGLGRDIIEVPMPRGTNGRFSLDLDAIDDAFRSGGNLLILCNPWNPVGTVLHRAELVALSEIVETHGGRVFADEIHAPIVYGAARHVPYASVGPEAAGHSITSLSASKAWNLPGLKTAQLVLTDPADLEVWQREIPTATKHGASTLGVIANTVAFTSGGSWLAEVLDYLDGNRLLLTDLLAHHLQGITYRPPDGTYLAWLDCRALELGDRPGAFFLEHARVALTEGTACGVAGHVRLNLATPRPVLHEVVERMALSLTRRRR